MELLLLQGCRTGKACGKSGKTLSLCSHALILMNDLKEITDESGGGGGGGDERHRMVD